MAEGTNTAIYCYKGISTVKKPSWNLLQAGTPNLLKVVVNSEDNPVQQQILTGLAESTN